MSSDTVLVDANEMIAARARRASIVTEPIVILGAGISGLAASLASGAPVYEAEHHVGGVAASDSLNGFTFDRGIHILQTNHPKVQKLLDDSGVRLNERSRQAYIYSRGTYTAYPFQVNTAGLPLALRVRCVWTFLTRRHDTDPANYEEWMNAKLGRGFADTFLIPYSEKFWTVHPREMTHEWTGNRVPQPSTMQVLRGALWSRQTRIGSNADFRYPGSAPGYGAIAEAIATRVSAIHRGHRAQRLDVGRHTLHFDNGTSVAYKRLISTIPLPELVRLCPDAPEDVRHAATLLRTNSILVVNLGIGRPARNGWHWVHFPEKELSFFRISFPHNLGNNVTPPGMSSISVEVAYSVEQPVDRRTAGRARRGKLTDRPEQKPPRDFAGQSTGVDRRADRRHRRSAQPRDVRRPDQRCLRLGEMRRTRRQPRTVEPRSRRKQRPRAGPVEAQRPVRRVIGGDPTGRGHERRKVRLGLRQQRTEEFDPCDQRPPRANPRQPAAAAAARETEKQRLGLVVAMVRGGEPADAVCRAPRAH